MPVALVVVFALRVRRRSREKFSLQPQNEIENPSYESEWTTAHALYTVQARFGEGLISPSQLLSLSHAEIRAGVGKAGSEVRLPDETTKTDQP